jgi:hypothetical protein
MAMVGHAKPDFGVKMKRLREERGVSLRQIANTVLWQRVLPAVYDCDQHQQSERVGHQAVSDL